MKIIMLSWEYPPRVIGGLARHVQELSEALAESGHEIHVVTADHPNTAEHETVRGVHLHRIKGPSLPTPDFLTQIQQMNFGMIDYAWSILQSGPPVQIIHSHEWLTAHAGVALKKATGLPLVATIHATESGRNGGIHSAMQRYIHGSEWWLCYEAWRVIVCSWNMHREVRQLFGVPYDKVDVIPNGVRHQKFQISQPSLNFRRQFAYDFEPIILFVGRLVPEKGAQVLIEAATRVIPAFGTAKFVIVGRGGMEDPLKSLAWNMGIAHKVLFTGYIDDHTLLQLYRIANAAVVPSVYEPFGIAALEAMAAGVPVVVADTGGLSGIVDHTVTGIKTFPGNPESLAWGILEVLSNPGYAQWLRDNAYNKVVSIFHWPTIAGHTADVYLRVGRERQAQPPAVAGDSRPETAEVRMPDAGREEPEVPIPDAGRRTPDAGRRRKAKR